MKKGALFGFDARISMLIYATLSLIAGAVLFSVIKDSKTTALYTELQEIAKANEAYILEYGTILEKQAETDELTQSTRKITDLVTLGDKLTGSPYLNYNISGNALKHPRLGDINIYTLSADLNWSAFSSDTYCSALKTCNIWVGLKGFESESPMRNLDIKFDDGAAESGNIRYDVAELEVYMKSIRVPDAKRDFTASGVWQAGSWGTCSTASTCGTGTQTRSVTCSTSYCSGVKPSNSQSCSTPCGSWITGSWGACSTASTCGTGTQTRSVYCSASYCSGSRPSSSQSCSVACGTWSCSPINLNQADPLDRCGHGRLYRAYCSCSCSPSGASCGSSPSSKDTGWVCSPPSISC